MSAPMLACGHSANAHRPDGSPSCAICAPRPESVLVVETPDLTDRSAVCSCGVTRASSNDLAFFEYRGHGSPAATDYCRCGYHRVAHEERRAIPRTCRGFEPRGPRADLYYCGHGGWD